MNERIPTVAWVMRLLLEGVLPRTFAMESNRPTSTYFYVYIYIYSSGIGTRTNSRIVHCHVWIAGWQDGKKMLSGVLCRHAQTVITAYFQRRIQGGSHCSATTRRNMYGLIGFFSAKVTANRQRVFPAWQERWLFGNFQVRCLLKEAGAIGILKECTGWVSDLHICNITPWCDVSFVAPCTLGLFWDRVCMEENSHSKIMVLILGQH